MTGIKTEMACCRWRRRNPTRFRRTARGGPQVRLMTRDAARDQTSSGDNRALRARSVASRVPRRVDGAVELGADEAQHDVALGIHDGIWPKDEPGAALHVGAVRTRGRARHCLQGGAHHCRMARVLSQGLFSALASTSGRGAGRRRSWARFTSSGSVRGSRPRAPGRHPGRQRGREGVRKTTSL